MILPFKNSYRQNLKCVSKTIKLVYKMSYKKIGYASAHPVTLGLF